MKEGRNGFAHWQVPRMWDGETVFVIGGGPSLRGADLTAIQRRPVIGINQAFRLGPWVPVTFFGDPSFFDTNYADLRLHPSLKVTNHARLRHIPWIRVLRRGKPLGIESARADTTAWNSNSGGSAINLAVLFGAKRIVLLGFDMRLDAQGNHNWHDLYTSRSPDDVYEKRFLPRFRAVAEDLKALGIECVNANPDSALEEFPKLPLEEAVQL